MVIYLIHLCWTENKPRTRAARHFLVPVTELTESGSLAAVIPVEGSVDELAVTPHCCIDASVSLYFQLLPGAWLRNVSVGKDSRKSLSLAGTHCEYGEPGIESFWTTGSEDAMPAKPLESHLCFSAGGPCWVE